jgi:carboxyl-terminal processing protease
MKKVSLKKAVIVIIITNIITASLIIFAPFPFINGMRLVTGDEYNFVKQYGKIMAVKNVVNSNYVDKVDNSKFLDGALTGLVASVGDKYTQYMDKNTYKEWMTETKGSYAGIGIFIGAKDDKLVIVSPIEDSPAEKAGIKPGDIIININGVAITAKDDDKAVSMMTGKVGKSVKLTVLRDGKSIVFNLKTDKIVFKSVKSKMLQNGIGYLQIVQFSENTGDEFDKAMSSLKAQHMKALILDLRNNPGGLVDQSAYVADKLLGKGTIVYTINNKKEKETKKGSKRKQKETIKEQIRKQISGSIASKQLSHKRLHIILCNINKIIRH